MKSHSSAFVKDIFAGQTSRQAQRMRAEILRVARRPFNILITGETGTGKTEIARQIHRLSLRTNKPFIELNCANLPEHLVEAELFGHRKGAFTGADYDRTGLFEEADTGMLFLDEIGDVPLTVQNRLLKAIEEKQIKRLGTNRYQNFDVQIIAATSRDLPTMIDYGEFREDLYCRLAVLTIEATPLQQRSEDIPQMIARFLSEASKALSERESVGPTYGIDDKALEILCELEYLGNIRALRNLIFELTSHLELGQTISIDLVRSCLSKSRLVRTNQVLEIPGRTTSRTLQAQKFRPLLPSHTEEGDIVLPAELCVLRRGESFKQWTARAKRYSIEAARQAAGGSLRGAAERLGLTHSSLKNHLLRAKRDQGETLFSWRSEND